MSIDPTLVAENVAALRELIDRHASRPVRIVAVTKRFGIDAIRAALATGVVDIGESYAQELATKAPELAGADPAPRWHFIGHVQRNKVKLVADVVHLWHAVDSTRLGREIAKRAPRAPVMVQVNSTGAATQSGVDAAGVGPLVDELRTLDLDVRGLMTIGALGDPAESGRLFTELRAAADALELPDCSMGMSGDLVEALEAGSTMVRVGTGLFGPRPTD